MRTGTGTLFSYKKHFQLPLPYHQDILQGVTRTGQSLQETIKQLTNIRHQQGHVKAETGVTLLRMEYITSHFIVQILISNKIITTLSISNLTPMG